MKILHRIQIKLIYSTILGCTICLHRVWGQSSSSISVADSLLKVGQPNKAALLYSKVLASNTSDSTQYDALTGLAQTYHTLGKTDSARVFIEKSLIIRSKTKPKSMKAFAVAKNIYGTVFK